jgi:cytochrome d ubiquinol oxidase subunit I
METRAMEVLTLSRIQFAVATYFHFLFVPLTLGLSVLTAIMQTVWYRTGDEDYRRMTKFWGRLFLINFAVGVVTGLTLEFQFGTNWSRYSAYVGDIFGSLLAVEATVAFFLESTFIAVWFFGWNRVSKKVHLASIWLVAAASNISAFWILTANAWMQHPVGYVITGGRAELRSFAEVVTQPYALFEFAHTVSGGYLLAGFFVAGISAWHLLRRREAAFFTKSFTLAITFALIFSLFEIFQGHMNGALVSELQPAKLAAMESHWETRAGAAIYLLQWPDAAHERNRVQLLGVPPVLSFLAYLSPDAVVKGLKEWPVDERPPVLPVFLAFRAMVGLGVLFVALSAFGFWKRKRLADYPWYLKAMVLAIPLPYVANELGWTVAELGRQPWIVYGLMRTRDAVSSLGTAQVATTLIGFVLVYGLLGAVDFYLLAKYARRGPDAQ